MSPKRTECAPTGRFVVLSSLLFVFRNQARRTKHHARRTTQRNGQANCGQGNGEWSSGRVVSGEWAGDRGQEPGTKNEEPQITRIIPKTKHQAPNYELPSDLPGAVVSHGLNTERTRIKTKSGIKKSVFHPCFIRGRTKHHERRTKHQAPLAFRLPSSDLRPLALETFGQRFRRSS